MARKIPELCKPSGKPPKPASDQDMGDRLSRLEQIVETSLPRLRSPETLGVRNSHRLDSAGLNDDMRFSNDDGENRGGSQSSKGYENNVTGSVTTASVLERVRLT